MVAVFLKNVNGNSIKQSTLRNVLGFEMCAIE